MEAYTSQERPEAILDGFAWGTLAANSKVVDVAGGLGTVAAVIAGAHRQLQFVVEDRQSVIEHSKKASHPAARLRSADRCPVLEGEAPRRKGRFRRCAHRERLARNSDAGINGSV